MHTSENPEITNLVSQTQLFLAQLHTTPNALRNTEPLIVELPCELQADTPEARATLSVDTQARSELIDDGTKVPSLQATA
jgi:hypothetical protein